MTSSSFLHASLAKALSNVSNSCKSYDPKIESLSGMRLLLVEEDSAPNPHDVTGSPMPMLAFSLVMDTVLAIASSSKLACRGCGNANDESAPKSCNCCKLALLIPGETKKSRKRRMQPNNIISDQKSSQVVGTAGKMEFPMNCIPENKSLFSNEKHWDETLLNQIHIKYVSSFSDMIKYLAYAPSLPDHLQPLDGIFVLGLGDFLSRDNNASGLTEMTHVCEWGYLFCV